MAKRPLPPTRFALLLGVCVTAAACGGGAGSSVASAFDRRLERLTFVEWELGEPSVAAIGGAGLVELLPVAGEQRWRAAADTARRDESGRWQLATGDGRTVTLERDGLDLRVDGVERLELELEAAEPGPVVVEMDVEGSESGDAPRIRLAIDAAGSVAFDHPFRATGTLRSIRLRAPAGTRIDAVRLAPLTQVEGTSPRSRGGRATDAGLVALQREHPLPSRVRREARRALPARAGTWQVAEYEAGGGAFLHAGLALPAGELGRAGPAHFQVWARSASSAPPPEGAQMLAEVELDPTDDADRWRALTVDLPGGVGELWEVLLVADGPQRPGRVLGLWGEPVLVRRAVPRPPNLVLVTADTLRADHVGATRAALGLGSLPGLRTPTIDALASEGLHFVDALATSNSTSPSHASILTGLFVRDHGIVNNRSRLSEDATVVAELLRDRYLCVSNVTARHLNATVSGLGQGFDVAFEVPETPGRFRFPEAPTPFDELPERFEDVQVQREGRYSNARLDEFLEQSGELPLFVWLHYFDPHTPYRVARAFRDLLPADESGGDPLLADIAARHASQFGLDGNRSDLTEGLLRRQPDLWFIGSERSAETMRQLYAAGVSEFDARLGEALEALGGDDRESLVLFTADHGESLGERDLWFAHGGLYANTVSVPMVLAGPGVPSGRVSRAPASTVDVVPTLLALAGIAAPEALSGRSLLALEERAEPPRRRWFQHASLLETGFREGERHVISSARDHAFGTFREPRAGGRLDVLIDDEPRTVGEDEAARLREEIEAWSSDTRHALEATAVALDDAARAELRALGYTEE